MQHRRAQACAECGTVRDGQLLEYDDPSSESGVTCRFVCFPCLQTFADAWHEQRPADVPDEQRRR